MTNDTEPFTVVEIEAAAKVLYEYGWQGSRTWERDARAVEGYRAKARAVLEAARAAGEGI